MGIIRVSLDIRDQPRYCQTDRGAARAEGLPDIQDWIRLTNNTLAQDNRKKINELKQTEAVRNYKALCSRIERKRGTVDENRLIIADLDARIRTGQKEWEITGNTMKGDALFLSAIWHYLKDVSYPDNPPEWRGGKVLIILDEGILNTDDYKEVRAFIRNHFYIKAIISLTRDTFIPISNTTTKTSILYAVKKTDPGAHQKEPIFFGHIEYIGLDTKGKVCRNDLDWTAQQYIQFKQRVLSSYVGLEFIKERFEPMNGRAA